MGGATNGLAVNGQSSLKLVEVRNWKTLRAFFALRHRVYGPDSFWVPPLTLQILIQLGAPIDRTRRLLLALDGDEPVASIGVKIHGPEGEKALHFGFFECLEGYPEAATLLLEEAHRFAPELSLRGPFNFRMEDPYTGLLVDGFHAPPSFWSSYNPPYYEPYLAACGLQKAMDLYTYRLESQDPRLEPLKRLASRVEKRGIGIRTLNPKNRTADIRDVAAVMNDALSDNWGFEEFTEGQVRELTLLSYLFLDPKWLFLAEKDGRSIGCCITLDDFNPWLKASNGRLTPWLLWKLLFCKHELTRARAWALGALSDYRRSGTGPALLWATIQHARDTGVTGGEVSWVLESNDQMNALLLKVGGERSRVHRILERAPLV